MSLEKQSMPWSFYFPTSHDTPEDDVQLYDNLGLLVEAVQNIFELLGRNDEDYGGLATIGVCCCEEIQRRAKALYEWEDPKSQAKAGKEV